MLQHRENCVLCAITLENDLKFTCLNTNTVNVNEVVVIDLLSYSSSTVMFL
jgi:hypothetical protein